MPITGHAAKAIRRQQDIAGDAVQTPESGQSSVLTKLIRMSPADGLKEGVDGT